jgi:signal peptidase I
MTATLLRSKGAARAPRLAPVTKSRVGAGFKRNRSRIGALIAVAVVAFMVATSGRLPVPFTDVGIVVVSGDSMAPTMKNGDVVVYAQESSYEVGDVVVFPLAGEAEGEVIHRVTSVIPVGDGTEDQYVTQGDNRASDDGATTSTSEIRGSNRLRVPLLGLSVLVMRRVSDVLLGSWAGLALTPGLLLGFVTLALLWQSKPKKASVAVQSNTLRKADASSLPALSSAKVDLVEVSDGKIDLVAEEGYAKNFWPTKATSVAYRQVAGTQRRKGLTTSGVLTAVAVGAAAGVMLSRSLRR